MYGVVSGDDGAVEFFLCDVACGAELLDFAEFVLVCLGGGKQVVELSLNSLVGCFCGLHIRTYGGDERAVVLDSTEKVVDVVVDHRESRCNLVKLWACLLPEVLRSGDVGGSDVWCGTVDGAGALLMGGWRHGEGAIAGALDVVPISEGDVLCVSAGGWVLWSSF
eukprot:269245-Amphidinium_carterae.2